jgi:hypothetical protein
MVIGLIFIGIPLWGIWAMLLLPYILNKKKAKKVKAIEIK